ncbi:MAG: hypothetical protein QMD61_10635 [Methanobacterium sp.]|nr:hypothetical protein [Methanobacterium sp.]
MLKFEEIKEFDIERADDKSFIARNFQIIYSDDVLNGNDSEKVEDH